MEKLECPECGFKQSGNEWCNDAIYEHDGRISTIQEYQLAKMDLQSRGDYARCPNCASFLHIDYDLLFN